MTVNTLENNYQSSLMTFKTKQDHPKTYQHTQCSIQQSSGNQQFMQISGTLLRQEEQKLGIYIFTKKGISENTSMNWPVNQNLNEGIFKITYFRKMIVHKLY